MKLSILLLPFVSAFLRNGTLGLKKKCYLHALIRMGRCQPQYECDYGVDAKYGRCRGKIGTKCEFESDCLLDLTCVDLKCTKIVATQNKPENETVQAPQKELTDDVQVGAETSNLDSTADAAEFEPETVVIVSINGTFNIVSKE